jgi:6-phosphogluconolactonase
MSLDPEILIFDDADQLARAAAVAFSEQAQSFITRQGRFSVALSGGNTPRRVYELLASDEFKNQIAWKDVYIFFGDERPVPRNHPASNYGMAFAALLSKVPIPAANIHAITGDGDPNANARSYESELRSFFPDAKWPRLDLVLLGLGEDGHTASLFPGTQALKENKAWVMANWVERLSEFRITLTAPVLNAATNVLFLVTGENKAASLVEIMRGPYQPECLPAQLIRPQDGSLVWMVDAAAARMVVGDA